LTNATGVSASRLTSIEINWTVYGLRSLLVVISSLLGFDSQIFDKKRGGKTIPDIVSANLTKRCSTNLPCQLTLTCIEMFRKNSFMPESPTSFFLVSSLQQLHSAGIAVSS